MRVAAVASVALLVAAAPWARAQRPDPPAAESARRPDAAQLQREAGRIRAHRRARQPDRESADSAPSPGEPAPPAERRLSRPFWRASLGASAGTSFLHDDNGVAVRPGVAPVLGLEVGARVDERSALALALRVSRPSVNLDAGGASWDGGSATIADAGAVYEWELLDRLALRAGAGVAHVKGPADVAPFRFNNGSPFHLAGEAGARFRFAALAISASLAWHAFRFGGAGGEAGVVHRAILGVTYGR